MEITEKQKEIVIEPDQDLILDCIPVLIKENYVASKGEFIESMKQGGICVNHEKLGPDEFDRVLICGDIMEIGKNWCIKIIK